MSTTETPTPPAKQPAVVESPETRVAFLEEVVSAGNAVGRRPGTAPTTVHIADERSAAEVQAGVPPKNPALNSTKPTAPGYTAPAPAVPAATYDANATYALNAVVTFNGVRYGSLGSGNHGNAPNASPSHWHTV